MIFGAILAGGTGSRMNISEMPKQFLPLGGKPIIIHTLEKFLICGRFDAVYIGVHPNWVLHMEDLLGRYITQRERVHVTAGGGDRNETIQNIIGAIETDFGEDDGHIIVTHDSVRPFVTLRIIEENIDAALECGACDTVVPAVDTIVESQDGEMITSIPRRDYMYQGQTPQSFNLAKLKELMLGLTEDEKSILTDACKIFVLRGEKVALVRGDSSNMKITYPQDMRLASALLEG